MQESSGNYLTDMIVHFFKDPVTLTKYKLHNFHDFFCGSLLFCNVIISDYS